MWDVVQKIRDWSSRALAGEKDGIYRKLAQEDGNRIVTYYVFSLVQCFGLAWRGMDWTSSWTQLWRGSNGIAYAGIHI